MYENGVHVDKKIKILMLADHPLSCSGVGTQARYLITGLVATGRYSFRVFGGAVKHEDYKTVTVNDDFIIKPTNGFGDRNMLRQALAQEKPDVLMLFTDPRFFIWVWEMEDEIHQFCPIAYNHLWDNPPWPEFNRVLYESTDLINCINHPTYEMVHARFPEKTNYIPHAVPADLFFPLPDSDVALNKRNLLGLDREDHFIVTFVSRNARRKRPADIMSAFAKFLDELKSKHGHRKASLLMHTDPLDPEGPNLHHVTELLKLGNNLIFSKDRTGFKEMNVLYNISDVVVNASLNEGFGLSTLEAKMCERPVIAVKTGGLTRQVEDHTTGFEYGIALEPTVKMFAGNQLTPYIYEDIVAEKQLSDAYMKMYEIGHVKRRELGKLSRRHALEHYNLENVVKEWDRTLSTLAKSWHSNVPKKWRHIEL